MYLRIPLFLFLTKHDRSHKQNKRLSEDGLYPEVFMGGEKRERENAAINLTGHRMSLLLHANKAESEFTW